MRIILGILLLTQIATVHATFNKPYPASADSSLSQTPTQTPVSATAKDSTILIWQDCKDAYSTVINAVSLIPSQSNSAYTVVGVSTAAITTSVILSAATSNATSPIDADNQLRQAMVRSQSGNVESVMKYANYYGDTRVAGVLSASLYGIGYATNHSPTRITGRMIAEALVLSGVTTTLLKTIIGRARPYANKGTSFYTPLTIDDSQLSFPSGHATVAFTVSTVLAQRIDFLPAQIALYGLAAGTSAARMYYDKHWLTDVSLGAVIGTCSALLVNQAHSKLFAHEKSSSQWYVYPTTNGVALSYLW